MVRTRPCTRRPCSQLDRNLDSSNVHHLCYLKSCIANPKLLEAFHFLSAKSSIHPIFCCVEFSPCAIDAHQLNTETGNLLTALDLWDLYVGPVSTFSINTTVQPTPIPSSSLVPPPQLYYPSFPTGQQVPLQAKNESWKFPKDFWYGVAGAAYQIEGAAKAEGRAPSIWDVLSHRAQGYVVTNETGDIADNNYYQYKEGMSRNNHGAENSYYSRGPS